MVSLMAFAPESRVRLAPNKHMLRVAQFAGFHPSHFVFFQCERCVVNLYFEREAMEAILTQSDDRLRVAAANLLGECHGR